MTEAYKIFDSIETFPKHLEVIEDSIPLTDAAFKYAVIRYAAVFHKSKTPKTGDSEQTHHRLYAEEYVPEAQQILHQKLIRYRDKFLAHNDLEELAVSLYSVKDQPANMGLLMSMNHMMPAATLQDIPEIRKMISDVHDKISARQDTIKEALNQNQT